MAAVPDSYWTVVRIVFGITAGLLGLLWIKKCRTWSLRNQTAADPLSVIALYSYTVVFARIASIYLFFFFFGACLYWLVVLKESELQPSEIPQTWDEVQPFTTALFVAFSCGALFVLDELYRQTKVDIFFLDWEKPKGRISSGTDETKPAPVSTWRKVFMVNEWCKLQTYRRISLAFFLFWIALIMGGFQVRNLSQLKSSPGLEDDGSPTNAVVLYSINSVVWILLALVMWSFKNMHERKMGHRMLQFVDLLSLTNLSVFIFKDPFYGFYIHGRSVHPFADTDMLDLSNNLRKEENDLMARRGLNGTDQQTFRMYTTIDFHYTFSKLYNYIKYNNASVQARSRRRDMITKSTEGINSTMPSNEKAQDTSSKFLSNFIDLNLKEHRYIIQDPTSAQKLLSSPPQITQQSVLLKDDGLSFTEATMFAIEWDLLVMYFFFYNILDIYTDNVYVAASCTYFLDFVLTSLRYHFGKKNISCKTLIDGSFLMYFSLYVTKK